MLLSNFKNLPGACLLLLPAKSCISSNKHGMSINMDNNYSTKFNRFVRNWYPGSNIKQPFSAAMLPAHILMQSMISACCTASKKPCLYVP
jgi:hypothetical protein